MHCKMMITIIDRQISKMYLHHHTWRKSEKFKWLTLRNATSGGSTRFRVDLTLDMAVLVVVRVGSEIDSPLSEGCLGLTGKLPGPPNR